MKTWTIQFELEEGCDEFWESNPSPEEVLDVVKAWLDYGDAAGYHDYNNLKCIKIIDRHEHYPKVKEENEK